MALSRLFVTGAELHLPNKGFAKCGRWISSPPAPSPTLSASPPHSPAPKKASKKAEAAREKKVETVRSFVQRYMLMHPGVFPKVKVVHDKVGGSWYILKDILTEMKTQMMPESQFDKQIACAKTHSAEQATSEVKVVEEITGNGKPGGPEKGSESLAEKLDIAETHTTADRDLAVSSSARNIVDAQLIGTKAKEQPGEGLSSSATGLGPQRSHPASHDVESKEISRAIVSSMHSSEANFTETTDKNNLAPNLNFKETNVNCVQPNKESPVLDISASEKKVVDLVDLFKRDKEELTNAKVNVPKHSNSSASEKKVINLVDLFKSDKEELTDAKVNVPKHNTSSHSKDDNKHVIPLLNLFKRNKKGYGDDIVNCEKSIKQYRPLSSQEEHVEVPGKMSDVKGIFDRIIALEKDVRMTEIGADAPQNKINTYDREMKDFVHESIKILNLKKNVDKEPAAQTDREKPEKFMGENKSNSVVEDDRQVQEPSSCDIENRVLQLEKDEKATGSADASYSEGMSEETDSDVAAFDYPQPELSDEVSPSTHGLNSFPSPHKGLDRNRHRLLVKFLPKTAKTNDIGHAFGDCGPVDEIRILQSTRENRFNFALISFKTEDGLTKALSKTDIAVCGADVVVEPASPKEVHSRMFDMGPVNDADFPFAFLKNPSQTVMVKGLPDNLSFHYLKRALSFWGRVSAFAMGSLVSNAYVEFESEESKERALAAATISVQGRKLSIYRVDAPKTTVVRISRVNPLSGIKKIHNICDSYGQVKRLVGRDIDTFDVHFRLSEWPNILKILNRLNGLVVDQHQWLAQPATVIPAEILKMLWNEPSGRKHLQELIQDLCRKLKENCIDTEPMLGLAREYYANS